MLFRYIAIDPQGKKREDQIEATSVNSVLIYLANQGLKPISVKPLILKKSLTQLNIGREKISLTDKVFIFKYLSLMLSIGTDLFKAIDILIEDYQVGSVRKFLMEVRYNLEKGVPFYMAFSNRPYDFSEVMVNLIKAGETSGNLEIILKQIAQDLERERELKSKIKSSLAYPAILIVVSFLMVFFLVTFLVPKMSQSFLQTGMKMPTYTKIILSVGMFLNKNVYWFFPLILISFFALYFYLAKTMSGKKFLNRLAEIVPVIRNLMDKIALERLTSILASLLKAGVSIIKAIEITAGAVGSLKFKGALLRISREYLPKGVNLGEAFKKDKVFPAVLANLMFVGEKAGHTEEILESLSHFYETEIDANLKTLVSFLEPVLLVIIGIIVGGLALAVIVPVYQMVGQF